MTPTEKTEAFIGKVLGDTSATFTTMLAVMGDRLGLFKKLAEIGTTTASDFAKATGYNERYLQEWLGGMATAGYLEYSPEDKKFTLPKEHEPPLVHEGGPFFFGGVYGELPYLVGVLDQVEQGFRQGGGVKLEAYDKRIWDGLERFTRGWFDNLLVQAWLPAMPDVQRRVESGIKWADVGCGRGRALVKLAQTFPKSTYFGFDYFDEQINIAKARVKEGGVENLVKLEKRDVTEGLNDKYDVISTFDVIHDAADPEKLLRVIRQSLKDDGVYICLEINSSPKLEENIGPVGAMLHGFSLLYCMTTSLAYGGAGLGTLGCHEAKINELAKSAGFSKVEKLPLINPFNTVYEIRP